jgi:hypothetical protein
MTKLNTSCVPLFRAHLNQNVSLWQYCASSKKWILSREICSSAMSILLPRLIFPLTINDGKHLKYSHRDLVHQSVNHRSFIGFLHSIQYDLVVEYLNNVFVHFFRQLKEYVRLLLEHKIQRLMNKIHYIEIQLFCYPHSENIDRIYESS